jgi:septal ring-binding cell division protein DamX
VQPTPSTAPPAKPLPTPAQTAPTASVADSGNRHDFLALPGDHYVIELAHAEREADVAGLRASLHLPLGEVYELHLRQNGGDWWLLVWASFDSVEAARAARAELPASITAGWPRRIAPLQAEVRRASEP